MTGSVFRALFVKRGVPGVHSKVKDFVHPITCISSSFTIF